MPGRASRWIATDDSPAARRLRSRVGGVLFVIGTVLDLVAIVAGPGWAGLDHTLIFTLSAVAIAVGVILAWTAAPISAAGWYAILTVSTLATGFVQGLVDPATSAGQAAGLIYIWLTVCAALYCTAAATAVQVALVAVVYAMTLAVSGTDQWVPQWLMMIGTCAAISTVVNRLSNALRSRAETDPLTGATTRRALLARLNQEIAVAGHRGTSLVVVMLDLDKFKELNDTLGHSAGDRALVSCVAAWRARLRPTDTLARLGGDEFFVVLPGSGLVDATAAAERLVDEVAALGMPLACSAGMTEFRPGDDADILLTRADRALYAGKSAGGNTLTVA